nr:unnamed protein product [Callosobruchus analis]
MYVKVSLYPYAQSGLYYEYMEAHPFQCNVCKKKYKYSHSLSRHKKYECGKEATFKCIAPGCQFVSKRKDNLTAHIRTLHFKDLHSIHVQNAGEDINMLIL